jgi:hypothetical protein
MIRQQFSEFAVSLRLRVSCLLLISEGSGQASGSSGQSDMIDSWPNKSPEPTAVGAVSSAVAVHAASRRWLSFFR